MKKYKNSEGLNCYTQFQDRGFKNIERISPTYGNGAQREDKPTKKWHERYLMKVKI